MKRKPAIILKPAFTITRVANKAPPHGWWLLAVTLLAFAVPVHASDRCELSVEAEELVGQKLAPGAQVELRVESGRPCYLVLLRRDAHGVTEIALPQVGLGGPLLPAGQPVYLPIDPASQNLLTARLPFGPSSLSVYGYAEGLPPELQELLDAGDDPAYLMLAADAAGRVDAALRGAHSASGPVVTRLPYEVVPPEGVLSYSPDQVVRYFAETTRSIESPKLDVYVNFALNEDQPLAASEPMLDLWGQVLSDPLLSGQRFRVGGHTDDLGSEALNQDLSLRRAQAVRDALVYRYGVDPDRLEIAGYGSYRPLVNAQTEEARASNRRVDFERLGGFGN